jgi:hypothetical protein
VFHLRLMLKKPILTRLIYIHIELGPPRPTDRLPEGTTEAIARRWSGHWAILRFWQSFAGLRIARVPR